MGLALLAASGPFAIDMYLPTLPELATDLHSTTSTAQLTLSGFMVGMALGQLVIGSLSDGWGRKKFLVGGAVMTLGAVIICALAPTMTVLIIARIFQGLGSGACAVIARSVIPDLATGKEAARSFTLMMIIQGIAPVIAPVIGGLLAEPIGWRGIFWVLAVIASTQTVVAIFVIHESRPPAARTATSVKAIMANYSYVVKNRTFLGYAITFAFGFAAMFCYISASPFVIQNQLGYSTTAYSLFFALNALGMMVGGVINNRLISRVESTILLRNALVIMLVATCLLVVAAYLGLPQWLFFPALFFAIAPTSILMGNATALATGAVRTRAGSAAAVMGCAQFSLAGVLSPLVGNAMSMSIGMVLAIGCALGGLFLARR